MRNSTSVLVSRLKKAELWPQLQFWCELCETMAYSVQRQRQPNVASTRSRDSRLRGKIRMVLVGKTGNGKSASGNTILNQNVFPSVLSACSLTSECQKARGMVGGRTVEVIDTPGICDTEYTEAFVIHQLKHCISLSAPGPHVFLIVIGLNRFTKEEQESVELLQLLFGEKVVDYSMVLFTHGDQLGQTRIEDFFCTSVELSNLIIKCKHRYHVFDNTSTSRSQVSQLLAKIEKMINENGGTFYTNQIFQEVEKVIQEQTELILQANAEKICKEKDKLKFKFVGKKLLEEEQSLQKKYKQEARDKAEKKNKFFNTSMMQTTAEVGVVIGAGAGAMGGPLCSVLGAVVGGVGGALVGLLTPAAAKFLKKKCSIQ